jgi:hypothetical protein
MSAVIYSFVPCCDPTADPIQFNTHGVFLPTVPGTYLYTGLPLNGLENGQCYSVTETIGGLPNPALPYLNSIADFELIAGGCEDEECSCGDQCFILTSCDGFVIYSDSNLILYNDQYVSLVEYPGECFLVQLYTEGGCGPSPIEVNVDPDIPCSCPCNCYIITGSGAVSYIECGGEPLTAFAPAQFCSISYPEVISGIGSIQIFDNGACDDVTGCPEKCFLLTNCDVEITDTITSNSFTLLAHALNNEIVTLVGYEGCWIVTETEDCECAVAVTVLQNFANCETCSPPPAYQLTNCQNSAQIIYTYQDLAQYVGQTVELDCGGCWTVSLLTVPPPSTQVVTVLFAFGNCIDCLRDYWVLTDCAEVEPDVYTYTDVSAYIGKTIRLKNCLTCWTVDTTRQPVNPGVVYIETVYEDECTTCLLDYPCLCSTVTNYDTVAHTYEFVDCEGEHVFITVEPGKESDRYCLFDWVIDVVRPTDNFQYFGNCVDNVCPPKVYPKRKVKPGYSVPVCSTERYERITCKASEIYYKMVLQQRYGISNCCDDLENNLLVKKELIDLDALRDPDYTCTVIKSCCNQPAATCGCSCNNTPIVRTCNS